MKMNDWYMMLFKKPMFRTRWNNALKSVPFKQYTIKSLPMTFENMSQVEAVFLIEKVRFPEREQDEITFSEYWPSHRKVKTVVFLSKTKKSLLVVPTPEGRSVRHIGEFVKNSSIPHMHSFWKTVGSVPYVYFMDKPDNKKAFHVETHGFDVAYLHLKFRFI